MFDWFKKQSPTPNRGPDFSDINCKEKAEARLQSGELEKLLLLPADFGGTDDPRNIVYVPRGFVAAKRDIDANIVKPLIESEKITEYQATPEYYLRGRYPAWFRLDEDIAPCAVATLRILGRPTNGANFDTVPDVGDSGEDVSLSDLCDERPTLWLARRVDPPAHKRPGDLGI